MTVLRSRKVVSLTQKEHSPKSGSEIEPLTPAKKEVEAPNNSSYETTPSSSDLVQSSEKLGSAGSKDSGSISNQGLRRSVRLSLNSSSYTVVDSVGSRRKRKVVVFENGEVPSVVNGSRLNVMDGIEKKSGSVKVSMEVETDSGCQSNSILLSDKGTKQYDKEERQSVRKVKRRNLSLDVQESGSESVQVGDVGNRCLKLRSGKKLTKPEISHLAGDKKLSASNKEQETEEKETEADFYGVSERGEEMEIDIGNDVNGISTMDRSRFSIEEKGKGKVIEVNSPSNCSDTDDFHGEPEVGSLMDTAVADTVTLEQETIERAGPSNIMDPKERFKYIAKENASKFAHFSVQEEDVVVDEDELDYELPEMEANGDVEDWPGPFSTALKIIKDRAANMPAQQKKKSKSTPLIWVPKKNNLHDRFMKVAPSLQDLCMEIMAENVDAITSLESVPDVLRHKITQVLCDSRKMNHHFFNLLASGSPFEIRVKDCSWLDEEKFTKTFETTDASKLMVLQLDQCGRCLPDYVLFTTLTHSPSKLSALTSISLKGACRLSDAGLNALVTSAPALRSINLGCCSLLTSDGIIKLADKLGSVLKELYIDECFGIDAKSILPALMKLEHLEVLSISRFETINDFFIMQFVAARGHKMKELVLADCTKLTDRALKAIAKSCPGLCAIDLTNVCKLTDASLGHLANGCQAIQTLKFRRNAFSDEAVAAYLEACGGPFKELSLNHVDKVAHHTALSLAKHAKNLQSLDLSWCREMTNEALGLIVDSCLSLEVLKLFGCTQITNVFTDGHSNEKVKIIGLKESQILKNIVVPDVLPLRYSSYMDEKKKFVTMIDDAFCDYQT